MTESKELFETVIKGGYCIGCGACAIVQNSPFEIIEDSNGLNIAQPYTSLDDSNAKVLGICPFSDKSKNEDDLSNEIFNTISNKDKYIGNYLECYVAGVKEVSIRNSSSSGGIGRWISNYLIQNDYADYFIHVKSLLDDNNLFEYSISNIKEEILGTSKSAYYPVSLNQVLEKVKRLEGRYIITGVPCFIKSIRLLCKQDEILNKRIKYTIGIVCGALKSRMYASFIGWEQGIDPKDLSSIDFRKKMEGLAANDKGNEVYSSVNNIKSIKSSKKLYVTNYGMGFFKPKACDYCDDVVAELADISIGDAWLPNYVDDNRGHSLVIVRNTELLNILNQQNENEIFLEKITPYEAFQSQLGGFKHRREGLSYRLHKKELKGEWAPKKRVISDNLHISNKRKEIYDLRESIAEKSFTAYNKSIKSNDINVFYNEMNPLINKYKSLNKRSSLKTLIKNFSPNLAKNLKTIIIKVKSKIK